MRVSVDSLQAALGGLVSMPVRLATAADAVAGVQPQCVVEPASEQEVADVLAYADRERLAVLPRGGGTQLWLGAPPRAGEIVLATTQLDAVLDHEPHDQTVTIQAGLRLDALQARLAQARQWLALDPVLPPGATIGGIIATNASGARRLRYGGVRDQLIGVRVALPDGTLAKGGGKVVKNVAGYDLPKLFTGSLGTLGVIVSATFRLYPLAAVSRTVVVSAESPVALCALALRLTAAQVVPSAIDVFGPGATLAVRFETGSEEAAEDQMTVLRALAGDLAGELQVLADDDATGERGETDLWREADHTIEPWPEEEDGTALLLKASLLPTEVGGWLEHLLVVAQGVGLAVRYRAHAGHGIVYARLAGAAEALPGAVRALRAAASATRGSLVVQEAAPEVATQLDLWGPVHALDVMRQMKARFDPQSTLNPGRFVGGI